MAYASLIFIRCHYLFANVELKCIFRGYSLDLKGIVMSIYGLVFIFVVID